MLELMCALAGVQQEAMAACTTLRSPPIPIGRLCDRSPSVRKKAVGLLAALLQPAAGLSAPAAAALADAVLPLAAQLLGVRPNSALHLEE